MGTPPVSTDVGGIPEVVRNGVDGILIKPGDPLLLADTINYLLDNIDKVKRMGKNGQIRAKTVFNHENRVMQEISLIKSLLRI